MNYAELTSLIQNYIEENGSPFTSDIDQIVKQAEERIYRAVRLPFLRKNSTGSMSSGNRFLSMPTDFLAVYEIATVISGAYNWLLPKESSFINELYPNPSSTNPPLYYAMWDNNTLLLGPTPDDDYTTELHYQHKPESIVTASTTWLGDNGENALLYACLLEAYSYDKGEEDLINLYQSRYNSALKDLKRLAEGYNQRDSFRNSEPRVQV